MSSNRRLVLFDIDGTLIETGGAGLSSLRDGFYDAFPETADRPFPDLDLGGATDGGVAMFLFEHFGLEDSDHGRSHFYGHYIVHLERRLNEFENEGRGRVLKGVEQLLDGFREHGSYELAVLTGNIQDGAWMKLRHYGLDSHFSYGAFGDDHHDRNELGPVALRRAEESRGVAFDPRNVVVVGDTLKDVACARAFGARAVAVATGTVSHEDLASVNPDHLLKDFSDHSASFDAIDRLFSEREQC